MELKKVLRKCMEAAKVVMQSEASSLMLVDKLTGDLCVSIPTGPVKDEIIGMKIPRKKGIGGWVVSYNQPFISNDVDETDVFWKDLSVGFTTKNIICVPIQDEYGEAFGVLQAINRKGGKPFGSDDVPVFEALAYHVASAIENARKFEEMEQKLEDQELYLNEIHHRLKNNLSAVSAVLELELDEVQDEKSRNIITAAKSRIKSVGLAHSLFYEQEEFLTIELSEYLEKIIAHTQSVYDRETKNIEVKTQMVPVKVDTHKAMLCGLIVNELLINAFKHAFNDRKEGLIEIDVKQTDHQKVTVCVTDDGLGFEDEGSSKIKGMFIIKALAHKLKAEMESNPNSTTGCKFKFSFLAR